MKAMPHYDMVISGAGPIGLATALFALMRGMAPGKILIVDAAAEPHSNPNSNTSPHVTPHAAHTNHNPQDARALAVSYGSLQLLQQAGVPLTGVALQKVLISQQGSLPKVCLQASEQGVPYLGKVMAYHDLHFSLLHALAQKNVKVAWCSTLEWVDAPTAQNHFYNQLHQIHNPPSENQTTAKIGARVHVRAEGGLFAHQSAHTWHHDYVQSALITQVQVSMPQTGCAFERFTHDGLMVCLPLNENGLYKLVWCAATHAMQTRRDMSDADLLAAVRSDFGLKLGSMRLVGARTLIGLGLNARAQCVQGQTVFVGNAAQTIHPIAAQGFNLGVRDAWVLNQQLASCFADLQADWAADAPHPSTFVIEQALLHYSQQRQADRHGVMSMTDLMARSLGQASLIKTIGLSALSLVPPVRRVLGRRLMLGMRLGAR